MKAIINSSITAFLSVVAVLIFSAIQTNAATFTVSTIADSGTGSLRNAVTAANTTAGADTINFSTNLSGQTIRLTTGTLQITDALTISGPGADLLTVSGNNTNGIFYIGNQAVSISGLTLTGGTGSAIDGSTDGSAIYAEGGTVNLNSLQISGNATTNGNGTVYFFGGTNHTISNTTFSGNSVESCGGFDNDGGSLAVTNTTIIGNTATGVATFGFGGGFCNFGSTTIINSTITGNSSISGGGGTIFEGTFSFQNTIIAGNTASSNFPEIEFFGGSITSAGNNLIGDATGDAANTSTPITYLPSDIRDVNPRLAPLGVYGGQTLTALLLSSSPAINAGSATNAPTTDERGAARVGNVDIGAFELNNNENNGANAFRATLPASRISQPYSQTVVPNTNGFTYTLTSGSLPGGVTLSSAGGTLALSGTPSQAGTFNFTLTATDGVTTTTNNYTLVIQAVTAASVNIAGRVLTRKGSGLVNAIVNLTDSNGNTRRVRTALNGRFAITDVASSSSYILSVQSKRYQFNSQTLSATSDMNNVIFTAQ